MYVVTGFLSFSSKDSAVAEHVVDALAASGVRCFYAPRDIHAGHNYAAEITRAIRACSVLVVLVSPNALTSVHVSREVMKAVELGKRILPFSVDGVGPADIEANDEWSYLLSGVQLTGYVGGTQIAAAMRRVLPQPVAGNAVPPPPPPPPPMTIRTSLTTPVTKPVATPRVAPKPDPRHAAAFDLDDPEAWLAAHGFTVADPAGLAAAITDTLEDWHGALLVGELSDAEVDEFELGIDMWDDDEAGAWIISRMPDVEAVLDVHLAGMRDVLLNAREALLSAPNPAELVEHLQFDDEDYDAWDSPPVRRAPTVTAAALVRETPRLGIELGTALADAVIDSVHRWINEGIEQTLTARQLGALYAFDHQPGAWDADRWGGPRAAWKWVQANVPNYSSIVNTNTARSLRLLGAHAKALSASTNPVLLWRQIARIDDVVSRGVSATNHRRASSR